MDNKFIVSALVILGIFGALFGLSLVAAPVSSAYQSSSHLFATALAAVDPAAFGGGGKFLVSFDNFKNVHTMITDQHTVTRLFNVVRGQDRNIFWAGTDHGLFLSRDGGLTWNRFVTSDNEITGDSLVFSVLPYSSDGTSFLVSVFENGVGSVYRTDDSFFTLNRIVDFAGEVPYAMYRNGHVLYLGMSTGQLIRYNLAYDYAKVVNAFSKSVVHFYPTSSGMYIQLSSGKLLHSTQFPSEFTQVKVPRQGFSGLFGSGVVQTPSWNSVGTLYVLSDNKVYKSLDHGTTFALLKTIPLTTESIDAFAVHNDALYVVSGTRMFISHDGGENWHIQDLNNTFKIANFYFVGGRVILGQ